MSSWRIRLLAPPFPLFRLGILFLLGIPGTISNVSAQNLALGALLSKKEYTRAGQTLAKHPQLSASDLRSLISLAPKNIQKVDQGFKQALLQKKHRPFTLPEKRVLNLLKGLLQRAQHQIKASLQTLTPLFGFRPWTGPLANPLGSMAIELSRRGNSSGLPILRKISLLWRGQAFASANLALALRLLGKYSKSDHLYQQAAQESRRAPWLLNNWGLCREAMGDLEGALRLFLEGARRAEENKGGKLSGDAATCQTNAALLLEKRRRDGDLARAIALLKHAVHLTPNRIRPRYYLHIFRIERSGEEQ